MTRTVLLDDVRSAPRRSEVLAAQGIPKGSEVPAKVVHLAETAMTLYEELATPKGAYTEVSVTDFATIYRGEGNNAHRTPLEEIYPRAALLALFAVTLGLAISRKIDELFRDNEPALGYALDRIASERADAAAHLLGERVLEPARKAWRVPRSARALAYSPGYCGWHITGQRALFARLRPERIGLRLNASCLMQPLKSVSGVIVAADPRFHNYDNNFDFCEDCATHQCRERIASIQGKPGAAAG